MKTYKEMYIDQLKTIGHFMKIKFLVSAVLVILTIIAIAAYDSYFKTLKNKSIPMTNQVSSFISADNKFSFDYPGFNNWDTKVTGNQVIYSPSENAGFNVYQPYKITVQEKMVKVAADFWGNQTKNSKGVVYVAGSSKNSNGNTTLTFRTSGGSIELSVPKSAVEYGIDGQKIWDTVLNSFEVK